MTRLLSQSYKVFKHEGLKSLIKKGGNKIFHVCSLPLKLGFMMTQGRSLSDCFFILQIGKAVDRIDAFPKKSYSLEGIGAVVLPYTRKQRGRHLNRYIFSRREIELKGLDGKHLDLGCGTGYSSYIMNSDNKSQYIGMDISRDSLKYAKKYYSSNAEYIRCSATEIPLGSNRVNSVTCLEILEHIPNPETLLQEVKRVLSPGGTTIISVPNNQNLETAENLESTKSYPHVNSFDEKELRDLIESVFVGADVSIFIQPPEQNQKNTEDDVIQLDNELPGNRFMKARESISRNAGGLIASVTNVSSFQTRSD